MRITLVIAVALLGLWALLPSALLAAGDKALIDSDHDGLNDATEQQLLERFLPTFWIDRDDCAGVPARFVPGQHQPIVATADGTIYGQATPRRLDDAGETVVELRYYHLWQSDCGHLGHPLDAEHVSVLVASHGNTVGPAWNAIYWYAAAHEDTICDASQITRAANLNASTTGATVWISRGKHASFFHPELCRHGCGGDACQAMCRLDVTRIVNLGEAEEPMNGSVWAGSVQWRLAAKMSRSDFDPQVVARLEKLGASDIVWVNPALSPAQSTIAAGGSTADAIALANRRTEIAMSVAEGRTGSSLGTTYDKVGQSFKKSARGVSRFLRGDLHDTKAKRAKEAEPIGARDH